VTTPGRTPGARALVCRVLDAVDGVVAAGGYPAVVTRSVAGHDIPTTIVPPGVDVDRFVPLEPSARVEARRRFRLPDDAPLVLGLSRLVPRKGFDVVIDAVAQLPGVHLAIGGTGRDAERLRRRAGERGIETRSHFLGRVDDADLPALYACADVFAMCCRDRWGGLEAEGFGIVFLEAQSCGVPAVAGRSGGSHEAVADGETGYVVPPRDVDAVRDALHRLLSDDTLRAAMGRRARVRAAQEFSWDVLAHRLATVIPS
jgi:phosphatidylinositol alpha-1,6-mannosyltransferase